MSDAPKKKTGSIAIPFLVTIFIGMIIIGGAAYFIYYNYLRKGEEKLSEPQPRNGSISISPEDSHTLLFILDDPEANKASATFMLVRSVPYKKHMLLVGIPSNSIYYSQEENAQIALKESYETGGGPAAVSFVQNVIGVNIDKYMVFTPETFEKVCDIFGGVSYPVDIEFGGYKNDGSVQTLDSKDIRKYLTYNKFKGGETERSFKAATIISYMINGSEGDRIAGSFDRYFAEVINATTSTDITAVDYDKYKDAIKYMFNFGSNISVAIIIDGEDSEKDFIPSSNFISNLPEEYFGVIEEPTRKSRDDD
ncbi:MAG: LytR family transcriptional regulator [Ruminococcus flavefaciens]|jgi:anionic cell wall polymer biosynthesis LytR-Cps2A-Psr (LCP) family protein|nr:LytR family transcriptional regulator [Ruminococcus flavefaciens]